MEEIKVSICCITYNQEKYIGDALESFLMQETDFKYEIIVHDDASTDQTSKIIKEYAEKYPEIVVPILQTENQYSQGVRIYPTLVLPKARGKYIALCEGDDYWIDKTKLQRQVDALEENSNISCCVHSTIEVNMESGKKNIIAGYQKETIIDLPKYLIDNYKITPNILFQTSSLFFRNKYVKELIQNRYAFYYNCPVGDIPLILYLLSKGNILFLPRQMSVYRALAEGSWSVQQGSLSKKMIIQRYKKMIATFENYDIYTKYEYHDLIQKYIDRLQFSIEWQNGNYSYVLRRECRENFRKLPIKSRAFVWIHERMPILLKIVK